MLNLVGNPENRFSGGVTRKIFLDTGKLPIAPQNLNKEALREEKSPSKLQIEWHTVQNIANHDETAPLDFARIHF